VYRTVNGDIHIYIVKFLNISAKVFSSKKLSNEEKRSSAIKAKRL